MYEFNKNLLYLKYFVWTLVHTNLKILCECVVLVQTVHKIDSISAKTSEKLSSKKEAFKIRWFVNNLFRYFSFFRLGKSWENLSCFFSFFESKAEHKILNLFRLQTISVKLRKTKVSKPPHLTNNTAFVANAFKLEYFLVHHEIEQNNWSSSHGNIHVTLKTAKSMYHC